MKRRRCPLRISKRLKKNLLSLLFLGGCLVFFLCFVPRIAFGARCVPDEPCFENWKWELPYRLQPCPTYGDCVYGIKEYKCNRAVCLCWMNIMVTDNDCLIYSLAPLPHPCEKRIAINLCVPPNNEVHVHWKEAVVEPECDKFWCFNANCDETETPECGIRRARCGLCD